MNTVHNIRKIPVIGEIDQTRFWSKVEVHADWRECWRVGPTHWAAA